MSKGIFIPDITVKMFREATLEAVETLLVEGEMHDVDIPRWIPVTERLPEDGEEVFVYLFDIPSPYIAWVKDNHWYIEEFEVDKEYEPLVWMPLPEPYREEGE